MRYRLVVQRRSTALGALLLLIVLLAGGPAEGSSGAGAADWVKIAVRGAACAHGSPYAFWVHPGSSSQLVLYFQDGGGCWNYATCVRGSGFYQDSLRSPTALPLPDRGIIDLSNTKNPFRADTFVYIPYCTGDVHWGSNVVRYSDGHGHSLTIHHVGFSNVKRVLAWVYERFRAPRRIFVTGCSAGSVGSAAAAPYVIRHYPHAVVDQLGDSLALPATVDIRSGWRADRNLPTWIPGVGKLNPRRFSMADYYVAIAKYYKSHLFAQFNYAADSTQARYFAASGKHSTQDFGAALAASVSSIRRRASNFHSYTAPGLDHCTLPRWTVYSLTVDGTPFLRWMASIAGGRPVHSVG